MKTSRVIKTSYSRTNGRAGWIDRRGMSCIPGDFDAYEGRNDAVFVAVYLLKLEGNTIPSHSEFTPGVSYSSHPILINRHLNVYETRTAHLVGFTEEEQRRIYEIMQTINAIY